MSHAIWRRVRRPFRLPRCVKDCVWEVYDVQEAGCLRCGARHVCATNAVDCTCPLFVNDDGSRSCPITGVVVREVLHSTNEYLDHVQQVAPTSHQRCCPQAVERDSDEAFVSCTVDRLLRGERASAYRLAENRCTVRRVQTALYKLLRAFKVANPGVLPVLHSVIGQLMCAGVEPPRLVLEAGKQLVQRCKDNITDCIQRLRKRGIRSLTTQRMEALVCGLLFLLRTGVVFQGHVLLPAVPEIGACLPLESKLSMHFGISHKVICCVENEIKMLFREFYGGA